MEPHVVEEHVSPLHNEDTIAGRTVAFPDTVHVHEEKHNKPITKGGVEMKRTLTQEERELAEAGYGHLHQQTKGQKVEDEQAQKEIHEHKLPLESLSQEVGVSFDVKDPARSAGLSLEEAKARLARDGPNILTPPKKKSGLRKFLERLFTMFNILLMVAGLLVYILLGVQFKENFQNTYLGAILIAVAFLNAGIDYYQIQKSEAILASFLAMIPPACRAVRDGKLQTIPAAELVKGDIVLLRMGDKTPADMVLFSANDLKVDNSSLTGESEPQERKPLLKGQIAKLTGEETDSESHLSIEMSGLCSSTAFPLLLLTFTVNTSGHFVVMISCIAIIFAIIFFVVGITNMYKGKIGQTFTFAISVLVAFVPEGLPSTVMLLLSIAAKRMAKQNVLVKDLQGVETLGSLTLLATDKTGTLTRNQMTVTNIWSGGKMYSAFQSNNDDQTTLSFSLNAPGMKEVVDVAALNSRIKFDRTDVPFDQRNILGDATETGLIRFAGRQLPKDYEAYTAQYPKVFEVPFNSTNKWALSIARKPHDNGELTLYIKGAPERVLAKCSTYLKDGVIEPITDEFKDEYDEAYDYMASRGHRVIACAQLLLSGDEYPVDYAFSKTDDKYPTKSYCFIGLVSLEDPPKHGVREAIGTLRLAGIKVMMVTGDHPKTAEAIARKINLVLGDTRETLAKKTNRAIEDVYDDEVSAVVVHGDDIDELQGWQWDQSFKDEIVFARTSPKHKLEIVKRAQALGHIVGVTGDGVNDSPALKKADLGIAMNMSGSDVSKEAANMILLDDNFASVVKGVAEGRQIFVNLKRSIQYTISHSSPEVLPQLLYVVVPIPLPLSAILILVTDLGFELLIALSFAWDVPETPDGLMRLKPRKPVTERSIHSRKKKGLRRLRTLAHDPETGEVIQPSRLSRAFATLRRPFTREFWEDLLEPTDDETLVDAKLLSYAYLEVGMIEAIGCLVAYFVVFYRNGFSPSDLQRAQMLGVYFKKDSPDFVNYAGRILNGPHQADAFGQAQSIVYLSIFILQCFNVFAVKARLSFPFGRRVIMNKWNFFGILAGACLGMFIVYTPPLHVVFNGSYHLSPLYWLIPMGFGVLILAWASLRVVILRSSVEHLRVRDIKGLMMFPTMRTMSMRSRGSRQ
ncbi:hypothetical protein MD484_g6844, partial [Candolleomyces efflorescens]